MWSASRRSDRAGSAGRPGVVGQRANRAPLAAALALMTVSTLLSACSDGGFRPLYGTAAIGGADVSERLAAVEVAPVPGRVGQRIRNEIVFQPPGGGGAAPPAYRLELVLRESVSSTLVKVSGDASGSVYSIDADFRLIRVADKQVVLQGKSAGRAGFERFNSVFSNIRARQDAEDRVAATVAQDLKTRLAAFLSNAA